MKNKICLSFFVLLFLTYACNQEHFIPDNIKDALLTGSYNINDTLTFEIEKNGNKIDTFSLIVKENIISTDLFHDYIFGTEHSIEVSNFLAQSIDNKKSISLNYESMDNIFSSEVVLDDLTFSLDIIEEQIDSIILNSVTYKNVYLLTSEYYENTYSYVSKQNGIIEIVADSLKLIPIN